MKIEKRVLILGIYKKKEDESLIDILKTLEANHLFRLKEGKKYLKELKRENIIINNGLTLKGLALAKKIEGEFKIDT